MLGTRSSQCEARRRRAFNALKHLWNVFQATRNYFVNTTHKSVEKLFLWRNEVQEREKKRPRWSWKYISVHGGLNLDSMKITCEQKNWRADCEDGLVDKKVVFSTALTELFSCCLQWRKINKRFVVMTSKSDCVCNKIRLCWKYMQIVRNWESTCKLSSLLPARWGLRLFKCNTQKCLFNRKLKHKQVARERSLMKSLVFCFVFL